MACNIRDNCFGFNHDCWVCRFNLTRNNSGELTPAGIDNQYKPINPSIKHPMILAEIQVGKERRKARKEGRKTL